VTVEPARPVPVPDALTAPFWQAAAEHRLAVPRCSACARFALPPDIVCPSCASTDPDWQWEDVSGRGRLRAWTVANQTFLPGFERPPVIIDVELAEQPELRLISRLADDDATDLAPGAAVRVAFDDLADDLSIPVFRLDPT
jgi:uncharacterized OB-fold protein